MVVNLCKAKFRDSIFTDAFVYETNASLNEVISLLNLKGY